MKTHNAILLTEVEAIVLGTAIRVAQKVFEETAVGYKGKGDHRAAEDYSGKALICEMILRREEL